LLKVPPDEGLAENVTVPVGVVGVPPEVSLTVAVQVVALLTASGEGWQKTEVDVDRMFVIVCPSNGRTWEYT
jgi:hypothetical protein